MTIIGSAYGDRNVWDKPGSFFPAQGEHRKEQMMRYGKVAVLLTGLYLGGCGGGGSDAGDSAANVNANPGSSSGSGTPIDAVGRIDAFGSVFVNGIKFETAGTRFHVDDAEEFDDSALSVGMIVRVKGSRDGERNGRAEEIYYDDEIEGLIANLAVDPEDDSTKRFTIFGTTIVANAATTSFKGEDGDNYGYEDLANGDYVEVSGDYGDEIIFATFIEKEDDNDVEVKGVVSGFDGMRFVLTLRDQRALNVALAQNVVLPVTGLSDGQFVEVEGTVPDPANAPNDLLALRIEIENNRDFDDDNNDNDREDFDDGEAEIAGIIDLVDDAWQVRMTKLQFDSSTEFRPASLQAAINDDTADGFRVKVKGRLVDAVLHVDRIEVDGEDDLEIKGFVESVAMDPDSGIATLTISFAPALGTVAVQVNNETMLKNDDGMLGFELTDLIPGTSFVEVHGRVLEGNVLVAGVLEAEDDADEYEIEGPLDQNGFIDGTSISVLGVTFMLDANTVFEDGIPNNGDIVDVEDFDRDGTADEVDVED